MPDRPIIIDAHTHLFAPDPVRYPAAPNTYPATTDGSVELLRAQMRAAGVDRAVTISPWTYRWDPSYTLDALAANRSWLAAAVLVDPHSPDGPKMLEHFVRDRGACGVRFQGRIWNWGHFDDPATTPLWAKAAELGLSVDINATHDEYPEVERRIREFPETAFILDHCGYITPELSPKELTVEPVVGLARYPNVYTKLTFFGAASREAYPFRDAHGLARQVIDAFGPERCMYGSNFPKEQFDTKYTYAQNVELFLSELQLTETERRWIIGGTAAKLWRWG